MPHPTRRALRRKLVRRLGRNAAFVCGFILAALAIGAIGYHTFAGLPWLDATLNAAMIMTGMGPVNPVTTEAAKLFAIAYALFSGVFFLTMVAVLLAPGVQHLLHRFHLEIEEEHPQSMRQRIPETEQRSQREIKESSTPPARVKRGPTS